MQKLTSETLRTSEENEQINILEDGNVERGDTESIFKELGDTINEDYHSALSELKESPDLDIWHNLYQNSLGLYKALNILHQNEPRHLGIKSANRHAFLEVRGYSLLICEQELLEEFEPTKDVSILSNLICTNKEFRHLYALWRWCQDIEGHDTGGFCDLAEEFASLERVQNARSASLRSLQTGQKKYGVDIDSPAPDEDLQILGRHIRVLFTCIRSCKLDEAIQLTHDNGLAALAAPLKLYRFLVDTTLSPIDPMDENHQISKRWLSAARLYHKMIDSSKTTSTHTRMLWAAVTGRLQPLLSMATRTTDRIWCFANAAIMNILLEACTGERLEEVPRSVESIFAEINTEEKSPYYSIYSLLLREDWDGLITWMVEYIDDRRSSDREALIDDQLVRFMAALATVARAKQYQHDELSAATIFSLLIDRLIKKNLFDIIPFYASFLPRQTAEDRLQDVMEQICGDDSRKNYLSALEVSDFDRDQMAITAASDTGDLRAETRLDNLHWLLLNGVRTLDSCVEQINCLVRYFTINDDHLTALEVLNLSAKYKVPEMVASVLAAVDKKSMFASNIDEYDCHRLYYFEAFPSCEKFSEHAVAIKRLLNEMKARPVNSKMNFRDIRLQQSTAQAVRDMGREAEVQRRKASANVLSQKTLELIEKLLVHHGWYPEQQEQRQRTEELVKVRYMCSSSLIELYLGCCVATDDRKYVLEASNLISKNKLHIEKAIGKEDLRRITKKMEDYTSTMLL